MSTVVATGLFTLAGVLVGGGLNLASGYVADRRNDRRERRTAARLILPELLEARRELRMMRDVGQWFGAPLSLERWNEYEATLARILDNALWRNLSSIYISLWLFNDERPSQWLDGDDDVDHEAQLVVPPEATLEEHARLATFRQLISELGDEDRDHIAMTLDLLEVTIDSLARIAGVRSDIL